MEVDVAGLLHGRNKFAGHICDQTANYVPQGRVLGAWPEAHRSQLFGKTSIESNIIDSTRLN